MNIQNSDILSETSPTLQGSPSRRRKVSERKKENHLQYRIPVVPPEDYFLWIFRSGLMLIVDLIFFIFF